MMVRGSRLAILTFAIALLLANAPAFAYEYDPAYAVSSSAGSPVSVYGLSINQSSAWSCLNIMQEYATITGTTDIINSFYSPDSVLKATSTVTGAVNPACSFMGSYNATSNESKIVTVHTGATDNITLENQYICTSGTERYFDIKTGGTDSYGNRFARFGSYNHNYPTNASLADIAFNSSACASMFPLSGTINQVASGSMTHQQIKQTNATLWFPFTTGALGTVSYDFSGLIVNASMSRLDGGAGGVSAYFIVNLDIWLFDTTAGTSSIIYSYGKNIVTVVGLPAQSANYPGATIAGNLTLLPNHNYIFAILANVDLKQWTTCCTGATYTYQITEPTATITIDTYQPAYTCTYSPCINGYTQKTCTDINGLSPVTIENIICSLQPLESAVFGMEKPFANTATICNPKVDWAGNCYYLPDLGTQFVTSKAIDMPYDWQIAADSSTPISGTYLPYFGELSSEWKSEGTRSFKLWTLPAGQSPIDDGFGGVTCSNWSMVAPRGDYLFSNDTVRATYNVTFPSTNMLLSYDVKRCDKTPIVSPAQTGGVAVLNWLGTGCPALCADNLPLNSTCSGKPSGKYYFSLLEYGISDLLGGNFYDVLNNSEKHTRSFVLNDLGIIPGTTYSMSFSMGNLAEDINGNCIYIDNVRYDTFENFPPELDVTTCASTCLGSVFYEGHKTENGKCFFLQSSLSDKCISSSLATQRANHESLCCAGPDISSCQATGTYEFKYDPTLADYSPIPISNSSDCHAQASTEAITTGSLGIPADNPFSALNFIVSPMFIAFILCLIISGLVAVFTKMAPLALITMIGLAFMFSLMGVFPVALAIVIIVLCACLVAIMLKNGAFG
jgi:hypothetical protein